VTREKPIRSAVKICPLVKSRGLYVSKNSENHLLKGYKNSDLSIEGENALVHACRKARTLHIEVVAGSEIRPN
jgi:hypothetical protein